MINKYYCFTCDKELVISGKNKTEIIKKIRLNGWGYGKYLKCPSCKTAKQKQLND